MADFRVDEIPLPTKLDSGPDSLAFADSVRIGNLMESLAYGTDELAYEPAEELVWLRDPLHPTRLFVVRDGDRVLARALTQARDDEPTRAWISVDVDPPFRGRGYGGALLTKVEDLAVAEGRSTTICYVPHPAVTGAALVPPTGYGTAPADDPTVTFLQRRGYAFEQVERVSRLILPVPELAERLAATRAEAPDYAVHTWVGRTPERWIDDIALMYTRMSTDAPRAGLDEPEDVWSAERLVSEEARREADSPRQTLVAAAEHLPSGRVVAFSELSVPRQAHRALHQDSTLVLVEHRGHRLGMLVKLANLAHLARVAPGHPSVVTYNAEENRPMLDVNEAVGFSPIGSLGAWQRRL